MRPGLDRTVGGGGPEHGSESREAPVHIFMKNAFQEGIESGVSRILQRISCKAVADVIVEQGVPVAFPWQMP